MAKSLETLRVELARAVDRHFSGTATGGSTTTIIDTGGLGKWTETDALVGAYVEITGAGSAAPEDESRRITAYDKTTKTITVSPAFSAAVESGDTYDLYLAPLSLAQWEGCVNRAIASAWPDVYVVAVAEALSTGALTHAVGTSAGIEKVLSVELVYSSIGGAPVPALHGQGVPPHLYSIAGEAASGFTIYWRRVPMAYTFTVRVTGKKKYPQLAAGESTNLDPTFVLAAARAEWYQLMADSTRGEADRSAMLQLMNHWQGIAQVRRQSLRADLEGLAPPQEGKRK